MSEEFGSGRFERAWETPEEVILRRELIRTPGLQPEDLGVLAELLLRDPWLPSTMEAIRGDLQAQGWKMGKDRYNAIAGRLTKAGHLARIPAYDEATQRPTWVTRVYRNPANNEQYVDLGITASMQVNAETRETRDPEPKPRSESRETRDSPGQSRIAENPRSGAGSRKTRDPETRVLPGQSRIAENPRSGFSPPTPPLGGGNTTPSPPTRPAVSVPSGTREGEDQAHTPDKHTPDRLAAAADFLRGLTGDVALNAKQRAGLAPLVLGLVDDDGWPLSTELLRALSVARDRAPVKNAASVVRSRIENLPPYQAPASSPAAAAPAGADMCPQHPFRQAAECRPCRSGDADGAPVAWNAPKPDVDPAVLRARAMAAAAAECAAESESEVPSEQDTAAAQARVEEIRRRADRRSGTPAVLHPEKREARVRRQRTVQREAAFEAEAEEIRRKANALLNGSQDPAETAAAE
ncbi:hypothetical protein [Streptomyces cinereoruber]|uniref:hypothetical protein n=1 Tax=Streptomyces cinereoruber TaxID=67260 RepID=UPI0036651B07